MRYNCKKIVLP
jgi:hypothetical protein